MNKKQQEINEDYQNYIHLNHYARWSDDKNRRETWDETVQRVIQYIFTGLSKKDFDGGLKDDIHNAILNKEVMPSMRLMRTAGDAADKDNTVIYNCAYMHMNRQTAFDELMHNLMCGCGQGYSVESRYVNQLPTVAEDFYESDTTIVVPDSRIGWCSSYKQLISMLYGGMVPKWDLSRIRPRGSKMVTMGGRASGPDPLNELFNFVVGVFKQAAGRKLRPIEVHDINCKCAEIVVVGGTRRSAMIALFDAHDQDMLSCKTGDWYEDPNRRQRRLSNNSAVYNERPSMSEFLHLWSTLYDSRSGEPGIFNRQAAKLQAEKTGRRDDSWDFGTNPCCEIILRDRQFCNLTEVVLRPSDNPSDIRRKVRLATILGTIQATFTDFKYLSKKWKDNCEEERLLGVSLTGIYDYDVRELTEDFLEALKELVNETNKKYAKKLGINPATSTTCVKPSGTVSQLVGSSSGIHPRFSKYYIRRVECNTTNPLAPFLIEQGVPYKYNDNHQTYAFEFPIGLDEYNDYDINSISAITHLGDWLKFNDHWCEHKPSCTIQFTDNDYLMLGYNVYHYFDRLSGISFFPRFDSRFPNAPYEAITKEKYDELAKDFPKINWDSVGDYEVEDQTTSSHELACSGGQCEI